MTGIGEFGCIYKLNRIYFRIYCLTITGYRHEKYTCNVTAICVYWFYFATFIFMYCGPGTVLLTFIVIYADVCVCVYVCVMTWLYG